MSTNLDTSVVHNQLSEQAQHKKRLEAKRTVAKVVTKQPVTMVMNANLDQSSSDLGLQYFQT